jgi:hypothetical protein
MKTTNLIILFCICGLVSNTSFAQLALMRDTGTGNPIVANPYMEVKGTPYLSDFVAGVLILPDSQRVDNIMISVNGYDNTLEYKLNGMLFAYNPEKLKGFILPGATGQAEAFTSQYLLPNFGEKRFVQVLEEGRYTLVNYRYKVMVDDVSAGYGAQSSKVFQDESMYYIARDGNTLLVKNKSKSLQEIFGDDYGKAGGIINLHDLDIKKGVDLLFLLKTLNSQ